MLFSCAFRRLCERWRTSLGAVQRKEGFWNCVAKKAHQTTTALSGTATYVCWISFRPSHPAYLRSASWSVSKHMWSALNLLEWGCFLHFIHFISAYAVCMVNVFDVWKFLQCRYHQMAVRQHRLRGPALLFCSPFKGKILFFNCKYSLWKKIHFKHAIAVLRV